MTRSKKFRVRMYGDLACFTRPEMKAERVSYEVMTPSAARGVLEAVLWKPAITWEVHEIAILRPVRWTSFRRNEVSEAASLRSKTLYFADDGKNREQRNTVALRDVDYVVTASFALSDRAGTADNIGKFEDMFARRLEKGQCFSQPYLGCREFPAYFEPAPEAYKPIEEDKPLALLFYDFLYPNDRKDVVKPLFFSARIESGIVRVPPREQVLEENGIVVGRSS